jgi:hypothetical protein
MTDLETLARACEGATMALFPAGHVKIVQPDICERRNHDNNREDIGESFGAVEDDSRPAGDG